MKYGSELETLSLPLERGSAAAPLPAGTSIGSYVIVETAGRGGFATVYRGRSVVTGGDVALKILHPELSLPGSAVRRLRKEAKALRRVAHPNIVRIHEVGEISPEQPYLAMEWLDGDTLMAELRRRGVFSTAELLGIMEQLCPALGAAHAAGIIHRDLKASNVMLLPEGDWFTLKLVDFGIAKLVAEDSAAARHSLTMSGIIFGTPHYMAPEQVLGQAVDQRADIYSLGVLSYLLLTGRFPFHALNAIEIQEMQLYGAAPRVGDVVPVPASVDDVIRRCLEKRREQRYGDVRELLEDLRRAVQRAEGAAPGADLAEDADAGRAVVGIYFAVSFDGPDEDLDDEVLGIIEEALAYAHGACEGAGLRIAFEGGTALLAAREAGEAGARAEVIELALALLDRWRGHHPAVRVGVVLHAGPAPWLHDGEAGPASGSCFRPGEWTAGILWDAVVASQEVLSGVQDRFERGEAAGPSRWVIARRAQEASADGGDRG